MGGGEQAGCRLKPQALGGGAGVNTGDWSGFIQPESLVVQNNSLISNRLRVVSFWMSCLVKGKVTNTYCYIDYIYTCNMININKYTST